MCFNIEAWRKIEQLSEAAAILTKSSQVILRSRIMHSIAS
jgi:hypothetical protein